MPKRSGPRLESGQREQLRKRAAAGENYQELAKEYGITRKSAQWLATHPQGDHRRSVTDEMAEYIKEHYVTGLPTTDPRSASAIGRKFGISGNTVRTVAKSATKQADGTVTYDPPMDAPQRSAPLNDEDLMRLRRAVGLV
jgi:DNA invertase Pin-like site-specific DNA recombinase